MYSSEHSKMSYTAQRLISKSTSEAAFGKSKTTQLLKSMVKKGVVIVEGKGKGTKQILKQVQKHPLRTDMHNIFRSGYFIYTEIFQKSCPWQERQDDNCLIFYLRERAEYNIMKRTNSSKMTDKKSIRAAKKRQMDHSRTEISQIVLICEMGTGNVHEIKG